MSKKQGWVKTTKRKGIASEKKKDKGNEASGLKKKYHLGKKKGPAKSIKG